MPPFYHLRVRPVQGLMLLLAMAIVLCSACSLSIVGGEKDDPIPRPYDFVPLEKEPYTDLAALQASIVYPPEAKRLGVEGEVNIRVLVSKKGIPINYLIEYTDSSLLVPEALRLVMSAVFTPAIQNNQPIDCWTSISVVFKL